MGKMKGFVAGLLVGLAFAPRAGRETRSMLAARLERFFEMGSEELDALEDELDELRDAAASPAPASDPPGEEPE